MTASPPPADALREALEGFVRWWDQGGRLMPPDAIEEARAALAAAPAPRLDVERLRTAIWNMASTKVYDSTAEFAADSAAEYARLAGQEGGE